MQPKDRFMLKCICTAIIYACCSPTMALTISDAAIKAEFLINMEEKLQEK